MHPRFLLAATALLVGVSAVLLVSAPFTEVELPHGFAKHVLALEFARTGADVNAIVGKPDQPNPDRVMARYQIAIDAVLIGAYALFFLTAGLAIVKRHELGRVRLVGGVAIGAGLLAALFDTRENAAMLQALNASGMGALMPEPALFARLKWAFFFAASLCASPLAWRRSWLGSTAAVLFAAAGVAGLAMDLLQEYPTRLGIALGGFGGAVLLLLVFVLSSRAWTRA